MNLFFWITLARGILALLLGAVLLIQPFDTAPMLINFMGMFWLMSGILSVRWAFARKPVRGLPLIAGVLGIVTGIVVLARFLLRGVVDENLVLYLLALVILLTGLVHIFGGFITGEDLTRERTTASVILGLFEVGLGVLLFVAQLERINWVYLLLTAWALFSGFVLIFDALYMRRIARLNRGRMHENVR